MFKPVFFLSLYTIAGLTGWGAYSTIANKDTSIDAIKQYAATVSSSDQTVTGVSKSIYRWKDHKGNWQYGELKENPNQIKEYEKELSLLRSLPREVLPTQALKPGEKDISEFIDISEIPGLNKLSMLFGTSRESEEAEAALSKHGLLKSEDVQKALTKKKH